MILHFYAILYKIEHIRGHFMAQATFSIRMDTELKKEFDAIVEEMGMNATTAFNIFARTVVKEKKIPFSISIDKEEQNLTQNQLCELLKILNTK